MARWDDERRPQGGRAGRDERWAGRGEPWPGRGQERHGEEREGREDRERTGERAWATPAREGQPSLDARSAGSRGHDFRDDERASRRARTRSDREPSVGDPSIGDEDGWQRSTQFEPTGAGPGSYGPEGDRGRGADRGGRAWRARPLGRGPKGYRRPDERIHEDLAERLATSNVRTDEVELAVSGGVVTLSGRVESRWDKRALEELAEDTFGVTSVENRLRVDSAMDRARRANHVGDDTGEDLHR
jgi:hypothetical protein